MQFELLVLKRLISPGTWLQPKRYESAQIVQGHKGHFPSPVSNSLPDNCVLSSEKIGQPQGGFTKYLAKKYSTGSTQTLVYLSPIPDCKGADAFRHYSYEGISVNAPELISPSLVVNDSAYGHFLSVEVDQATHDLDAAIRAHFSPARAVD
jgi:hypothetical protein